MILISRLNALTSRSINQTNFTRTSNTDPVILGTIFASTFSLTSADGEIFVDRFNAEANGINFEAVEAMFEEHMNIHLDWGEVIRVSPNEEGQSFNFDTFDGHSIDVGILASSPAPNKIEW